MSSDLISAEALRALRYVAQVEDGGGELSPQDLDAWMIAPSGKSLASWSRQGLPLDLLLEGSPGYAEYLAFVGWVTFAPLRVTSTGRAVLCSSERSAPPTVNDPQLVVLSPEDPLNAVAVTKAVGAAQHGLLVDPYFDDELMPWLLETTSIARVLTCRRVDNRRLLGMFVGAAETAGREIEVRCLPPKGVHDRYLVDANGAVSMFGASLNGLHANFTVVAPLPEPGAEAVRAFIARLWDEAEPVPGITGLRDTASTRQET